jgi:hypothetical protein
MSSGSGRALPDAEHALLPRASRYRTAGNRNRSTSTQHRVSGHPYRVLQRRISKVAHADDSSTLRQSNQPGSSSGNGIADSNALVYSCSDVRILPRTTRSSTAPRCMTNTRLHNTRTTDRSWLMKTARCHFELAQQHQICARVETSRPDRFHRPRSVSGRAHKARAASVVAGPRKARAGNAGETAASALLQQCCSGAPPFLPILDSPKSRKGCARISSIQARD